MSARTRAPRRPVDYLALSWRVFTINAIVLALSGLVAIAVLSPGTISPSVATKELAILAVGLAVMLVRPARAGSARAGAAAAVGG